MTLKAFAILEKMENTGDILFAEHAITAHRAGANEYGDGDLTSVSCKRVSWADRYADTGKVPIQDQVEHGWHYECFGCGIKIEEDLCYRFEEECDNADNDDDTDEADRRFKGWTTEAIIEDGHSVFCMASCQDSYNHERTLIKTQQDRHRARLEHFLIRRFHDIKLIDEEGYRAHAHIYCSRQRVKGIHLGQATIAFSYPGMKHGPGNLNFNSRTYRGNERELSYTCAGGDVAAFTAFLQQHKIRQRPAQMSNKAA